MRVNRHFLTAAFLCASLNAQASFECYTPGLFPPAGPGNCEGVTSNNLGFGTGITATPSCTMPADGGQYARLVCNGPFPVPNGGPMTYPVPTIMTEARIPIPAGATSVTFCWEYFNAETFGSSFNDGTAIAVVSSTGTLIQSLIYADNQLPLGNCQDVVNGFATEISPLGLQPFSGTLPPLTGGEYLSWACWNEGDNVASGVAVLDNVQFNGGGGQICPPPPPPLSNDTCTTAQFITEGTITGSTNVGASTGPDPLGNCGGMVEDVWFVVVPTCSGTYTATTCVAGTTFDTVVAAWDGTNGCGALTALNCNDDSCNLGGQFLSSTTTFTAIAGTLYFISVGGFFGNTGTFNLLVQNGGGMSLTWLTPTFGCIGYSITGAPQNGAAFTAVSLTAGAYPVDWFYGIAIMLQDLSAQIAFGFPFIVGLDSCGNGAVGPFCGYPSGLTLYGVALGLMPGSSTPSANSPPATATIL